MFYTRVSPSLKNTASHLIKNTISRYYDVNTLELLPTTHMMRMPLTRPICTTNICYNNVLKKPPLGVRIITKVVTKLKFIDYRKYKLMYTGALMYENVADRIDYTTFFTDFQMKDTFFSWFLITELHVWMLMVRCMQEGKDGILVRKIIVETMWHDVDMKMRKLGPIAGSMRRKQIMELSAQFNAAIIGYDEGLMSDDKTLAGAIWRRFFHLECNNPENVERLILYMRKQIAMLDTIPRDTFLLDANTPWLEIKEINIR